MKNLKKILQSKNITKNIHKSFFLKQKTKDIVSVNKSSLRLLLNKKKKSNILIRLTEKQSNKYKKIPKYFLFLKKKYKLFQIYYRFNYIIFIFQKLTNCIMHHGKKALAVKLLNHVCCNLTKTTNRDIFNILLQILIKCLPLIEIKRRLIGRNKKNRRFILVPYLIENPFRSLTLAIRWIIAGARKRYYPSFTRNFYDELLETYKNLPTSESLKLYNDNQKLIFENRANIRFNW